MSSDHYMYATHTHTPHKCLNYKPLIDMFLRPLKLFQSHIKLFLMGKMILK